MVSFFTPFHDEHNKINITIISKCFFYVFCWDWCCWYCCFCVVSGLVIVRPNCRGQDVVGCCTALSPVCNTQCWTHRWTESDSVRLLLGLLFRSTRACNTAWLWPGNNTTRLTHLLLLSPLPFQSYDGGKRSDKSSTYIGSSEEDSHKQLHTHLH